MRTNTQICREPAAALSPSNTLGTCRSFARRSHSRTIDEKGGCVRDGGLPTARKARAANPAGKPAILPNLGGSLPNDIFAVDLGLPTVWVPHSYPGCSQHAPNEHLLAPVARQALTIMSGIYWDLGEAGVPV